MRRNDVYDVMDEFEYASRLQSMATYIYGVAEVVVTNLRGRLGATMSTDRHVSTFLSEHALAGVYGNTYTIVLLMTWSLSVCRTYSVC